MSTEITYQNYETPKDILKDIDLSPHEKQALLTQWLVDEEALIRAAEEGLDGGEDNMLKAVQLALTDLKGEKAL